MLGPLQLLMMHQKQFDHAGVSRVKGELVFCVEVLEMLRFAIQAPFQEVRRLDMLTLQNIPFELVLVVLYWITTFLFH